MNDPIDRQIVEKRLAFVGKMVSSASHELKNILSIVSQLGGLLEDLLAGARKGEAIAHDHLQRIAEGVSRAVQRGDDHVKKLHRFSHRLDAQSATASLNEAVAEVVALCQRLANLKTVRLTAEIPDDVMAMTDRPFVWQHAIYECLCIALEGASPDATVTVPLEKLGTTSRVTFDSSQGLSRERVESCMPWLRGLMEELGGTVDLSTSAGNERLTISGPV